MKKLLFILLSVFALGLIPLYAQAECAQYGYITKLVAHWPSAGDRYSYIYVRNTGEPTYSWYGAIYDTNLNATALSAKASDSYVHVIGGATSCPTTGNPRWMGYISEITIDP